MFTRGTLQTAYGPGDTARPDGAAYDPGDGVLARQGATVITLPPPAVMHDPSDSTTWSTPVRWT